MAVKPKSRTVLEPFAQSAVDSGTSPIKHAALSEISDEQTLIYIANLSGVLSLYSLQTSLPHIAFVRRLALPGTGALSSILPLVHIGKVIVLVDGYLYLIDSNLAETPKRIALFRGVTAFSRKFQSRSYGSESLHSNGGGEANYVHRNGDGNDVKSFFAVGIGKKLVLAELVLGGSLVILKEIQGVFDGFITTVLWIDDSVFVGTKIGYYLYNRVNGRCELIFSLPDSSSFPRLKLLAKESRVMLMVDNVGIVVDVAGQPVGGSLVFKEAPDSIKEIGSYVIAARNLTLEVYHKKTGFCVQRLTFGNGGAGPCMLADEEHENGKLVAVATSLKLICYWKVSGEEQIKDLLRKKSFKEAISLVEELENDGEMTKEMLSFVQAQVGFLLLFDLHFKEAVDHFLLSENMQPSELFPFIMPDPNRWTLLVPRNRYWGLHPPPTPLENVIDDGLTAIQRAVFLKKAGVESAVDDEFLQNPPTRADLLESAIENMIRYLQTCRGRDLAISVKEGVDTLLMYLYRARNCVDDMERLASSENCCVVEELEALMNESGHLRTLAFLYAGKGMSAKAVSTWRVLARKYSSGSYRNEQSEGTDLQDPTRRFISNRETAAIEASKILEESSDQDLILQHLGWIADISQVLAVQILISEKRSDLLSPDEVIAAIDPKKVEILQRYLQWLIEDQDSEDLQFHTTYALLLAKSALETYDEELSTQNVLSEMNVSENGRSSIFDTPVRERLQIFLQSSALYDAEEVLDMIEESELWLEKAILYRRLGQEALVLDILALKLENFEAAENYCAEIGRPDAYMQLLDIYLDPKDGREPMFKAAVRLLHNHGEMLNPLKVLERLSPDMPLQLASDIILKMLRARQHHRLQGKIVHKMSHALNVDASLARLEERSRLVQINDESTCDSCHARLGTKLFAMYPDDSVVCYKCYRRQGESTSVSGRDFKKDILLKPGWLVTR
ncbi:vacuolar sorting protein 3-like [Salvia splendens]|uniref:vacuolar sorting protein 3-like n=1 Tax=Salvia splendens TaxID=180675 RepID=UPI001C257618|nr:vacuolar sorting protein 3-like [Salvia splendens]